MRLLPVLAFSLTAAGCNMTAFTANQTAPVIKAAQPAFAMESDPQLAREAAPGQLKTVEGFHLASPGNKTYVALLAQGYCEYAFGFLESDAEEATFNRKTEDAERAAKRATGLYLRCMNYGLELLGSSWSKALYAQDRTIWEKKVKSAGKGDVQGMFWTALGLASAINLNRDDIDMIAYLGKAKLLFERIVALDPTYYNGGAHMALGMLYSSQGAALGGNPTKGKAHFDKAIAVSKGRFLMPQVLMAVTFGVITQDREFFHKTLVKVLQTSPAIWPEQRLPNELAHIKAKRYLAHEQELF
jgi:hypothetical protein